MPVVLYVRWCLRCQGWAIIAIAPDWQPSYSEPGPLCVSWRDWLEVECAGPDENARLMGRVLRMAQESEQDIAGV